MISSQMLKGMLEGCILKIISLQDTYAYEISNKLEKYGFGNISEGTVYPVILRLQKSNQIEPVLKESLSGPPRKYYHLTEEGKKSLNEFLTNWKEFSDAIQKLIRENS